MSSLSPTSPTINHLSPSINKRRRLNNGEQPQDAAFIPYTEDYTKLNSSLQLAFSNAMAAGDYVTSTRYKKVCVLLLSWEPAFDDLEVQDEVNELGKVFKEIYNFDVESKHIMKDQNKKAQVQINKIVANWVDEKDAPKRLFIVYFAGHGRPGSTEGDLQIMGKTRPNDNVRAHLDMVIWNRTEQFLQDTHADVLQIFDCCYAGDLGPVRGSTRAIEYLAATSSGSTTKAPGASSFTRALIYALKESKSARFTTSDLLNKVREAPNFPPNQKPLLQRRNNNHAELIILEPLTGDKPLPSPGLDPHKDTTGKEILTLKFVLETRPSAEDVEAFGNDLNTIATKRDLRINRIMWGGLQARHSETVVKAAKYFMEPLRHRRPSRVEPVQHADDAKILGLVHEFEHQIEDTVTTNVKKELSGECKAKSRTMRRGS